ncbi:MAG TPA: acyl carrier protein [Verrucomicrobiae bacterium]|nr:acyl carrier protein [Verrucomicrobiae bacterium]
MDDFYSKLADILEVETVKPDDVLREFENWDSLTALSILATLDANYGINLSTAELRDIKTVAELGATIATRRRK